ncbi:unnamed protein product [Merluccius merluccius]
MRIGVCARRGGGGGAALRRNKLPLGTRSEDETTEKIPPAPRRPKSMTPGPGANPRSCACVRIVFDVTHGEAAVRERL